MAGKHHNWHKAWRRLDDGRLQHDSGLIVEFDDDLGWMTDDDTLEVWQVYESSRGVDIADLQKRLNRLLNEAAQWRG